MTTLLKALLALAGVLVFLECYMLFLMRHPRLLRYCPRGIRNSMGHLYTFGGERRIMQFLPGCGQHDEGLGYTLKPGTFTFAGREFNNLYHINHLGVRDDEAALNHPEVVVAGDSYAVGWGVDQEEMFSRLVARGSGLSVLNTAVPSYGTVREMAILRRVSTDRLRLLIIQYCDDDYEENLRYSLNGDTLKTMRAETFEGLVAFHGRSSPYRFGSYLRLKAKKKIDEFKEKRHKDQLPHPEQDPVDLFLHAILTGGVDLAGVRIIVFEMNGKNQTNAFTNTLRERIRRETSPPWIRDMVVLDLSGVLEDRHFYVLDDHLNREGHEAVAAVLLQTMAELDLIPADGHGRSR